jgi:ADP-heptose:LPS heptosyltransferase
VPKFLVVRFSSIGDIVLTTPVMRCLATQLVGAEVHMVTKAGFKATLQHNPHIKKLHLLNNNWGALIQQLKSEHFDAIVDLHHNLRTANLKWALGVKSYAFDKLNWQKFLFTNFKINRLPRVHIVDRYLNTVAAFGVKNDGCGLDYFIGNEDEVPIEILPAPHRNGYIALVIGAALATKQLPLHQLQTLCRLLLPHPLVLLGGPNDAENGTKLAQIDTQLIFNACGKFKLNQSASLVKQASLVITHDTGLMHIAAAYNKPILSIWGNTTPIFGMYPYYAAASAAAHRVFEVENLRCRPCSKIGYKACPQKHFNCMQMQPIEEIAKTAASLCVSMKTLILIGTIIFSAAFTKASPLANDSTQIQKAAARVCPCLDSSASKPPTDLETFQSLFLSCIMTSSPEVMTQIMDVEEEFEGAREAGAAIGRELAFELLKQNCPAFVRLSVQLSKSDKQPPKAQPSLSVSSISGTVAAVAENEFLSLVLQSPDGRKQTYYYFDYVPQSDDWTNEPNQLLGKKVTIGYRSHEYFRPKIKTFVSLKQIVSLVILK